MALNCLETHQVLYHSNCQALVLVFLPQKLYTTHVRNLPLSPLVASRTSLAITLPGCSGFNNLPEVFNSANLSASFGSIALLCTSRNSRCISVSTVPGRI